MEKHGGCQAQITLRERTAEGRIVMKMEEKPYVFSVWRCIGRCVALMKPTAFGKRAGIGFRRFCHARATAGNAAHVCEWNCAGTDAMDIIKKDLHFIGT